MNRSDIVLDRYEFYDAHIETCWSFRKKGDVREGIELNLGNMISGFSFEMFGHYFKDSECAYIAGCYSLAGNNYSRIQQELSLFNGGGYMAKRLYRNQLNDNTLLIRQDWEEFNFQWMLLVLWQKTINNNEFKDLLLKIPLDAHIIEDTSYHHSRTSEIWGAQNMELTKIRKSMRNMTKQTVIENGMKNKSMINRICQIIDNSINKYGIWTGKNVTGKCLKLCQIALIEANEPPIDYDLLNAVGVFWFGQKLIL